MTKTLSPVRGLRSIALALLFTVLASIPPGPPVGAQTRSTVDGQSVTLLPDGRELLLGGVAGGGADVGGSIRDPRANTAVATVGLGQPRAWHTATLLPDGTVLVLGGVDERGRPVRVAERIDLTSGTAEQMPALQWQARSAHSATLIDSNHILLAGGIVNGDPVGTVELLDLDRWAVLPVGSMGIPRAYHSARLLSDGRAELWGGRGSDPLAETSGAIIDRSSVIDTFVHEQDDATLWLTGSEPSDGALVPVPRTIMLRFSRPVREDTLTAQTVRLEVSGVEVPARIVPAERGRMVFLTPVDRLQSNTSYLVTVNGARDEGNRAFPLLSVTFSTGDAVSGAGSVPDDEVWDPRVDPMGTALQRAASENGSRALPPLRAPRGVTAVSGQVLRLNGVPLAGVKMEIEDNTAVTDATGRFLLMTRNVGTGWHTASMDGRASRGNGANYGKYEVAVWVTAGTTAVIPYTIWMPKIDTAHAVTIASPTTSETVVTTPLIPGLEVRIPAGAVITDERGHPVREISITPIPVNQPPFPLAAGADVPIYFTIQPGGAYITVSGSGYSGARLIYPNVAGRPPGALTEFWHYEPDGGRGWYVYGRGAVTADGRQIAPNPGVVVREFTGAMAAPLALAGGPGAPPGDPGHGGDPVQLGTGVFVLDRTDLSLPDVLPIGITRTYRTLDTIVRSFGIGATHQFDVFLVGTTFPYTYLDLVLPNGSRVHFPRISPGTGYTDAVYEHTSSPTSFFKARIAWNGNGWNLDLKDGSRMVFREGFQATRPAQSAVTRIQDRYGNAIVLTRNADADLTRIASPNGRWIELTYDASHRVTQAKDNGGRTVGYTYDASGRLWKVTDTAGGVTEYTYDTSHRMLTLKDARGITFLTNHYDANGRVDLQTQADSAAFQFAYALDAQGRIEQTDFTNPRGYVRRVTYDPASGYLLTDTAAYGTSLARTTTVTRDSATNLATRVTDGLARNTDYTYDSFGNVTSVTRLAGTADAVTTSYTYDATFNLLASVTDPLSHTTTATRDSVGNVTAITDPLSHQTTFTYTGTGLPLTATTPAGTTTFIYDGGDLVGITDPLGRTTTGFVDSLGRLVRAMNPLGQTTTHSYDSLNALTQMIDALGGTTGFTYDANRNILTLTDALNHTTTYTYNNMDRADTRTDSLSRQESFVYDANGNPSQHTDRKNQVTMSTYDALDRLSALTYQDGSTTTYTHDAGDRVMQIVDSMSGTITRTWDLPDRLTSETTPEGSVSYTYDAADRRATMTVAGQPQATYGYDNANRLTSITQGSSVVAFAYDDANRRTVLTLPNGVTTEYGYNAASELTSLTYKLGATTLGDLTYTYNLAGNRTSVGGSWARTGLPTALASATYDATNQIATWGGSSLTYDANGNVTNDGTQTYAWNARNQLISLGGGMIASFQYDGLGRRRTKTVSGGTRGFLYDRLNVVQELSGSSPSANVLSGLGIDEWLTRTDSAGTRHLLTDVLGSTVALSDDSGAVQTQLTYEPFGKTSVSGTPSTNSFQFTGRENDGTGLLYYRARYYNEGWQRFANEDPLGLQGGPNLHQYAANNPVIGTDPLGLVTFIGGAGVSLAAGMGVEGSIGAALNPGLGGCAGAGGFTSGGAAAGVNVSADVFFGAVAGGFNQLAGTTVNANISVGPISLTGFFEPGSGRFLGGTIGAGPGAMPVGVSGSLSGTAVGGLISPQCKDKPDPLDPDPGRKPGDPSQPGDGSNPGKTPGGGPGKPPGAGRKG